MTSSLLQITTSACILTASSNIAAQLITSYRNNVPYTINWYPVLQFFFFTALNAPPNFLWQQFLESTFPSQIVQPSSSAIAAAAENDEKELDKEQSDHSIVESRLNIPNTIIKFLLDQTIGATVNTLAFSLAMAAFQGLNWPQAVEMAKRDFWPLMNAGWKLWPLVCLGNYTLVKSVPMRSLVGSLAGVGWSIYLSLVAAKR